jgi:transposase
MDIVVARCAGLDVHKDTVVACVRTPGPDGQRAEQVRTYGTTTAELLAMEAGCEEYCEREVDEVEWQGGRVYLHLGARRDNPPYR